jgi:hypothetical protein
VTALEPVDEGFFNSAPSRYTETFAIARPAEDVWRDLTAERPLYWCRVLSARWTSPAPHGVGATRRVNVLGGAAKLEEYFFVWEEGHRYAFYATQVNLPVFLRFGEDYVVDPDGPDRCRFTWTIALEPSALGRPGAPLNAFLFRRLFAETRRHFQAV